MVQSCRPSGNLAWSGETTKDEKSKLLNCDWLMFMMNHRTCDLWVMSHMNKVLQTIAIMLRPLYMQWPLASSAEDCDCTWSKTTNTSKGKSTHPLMILRDHLPYSFQIEQRRNVLTKTTNAQVTWWRKRPDSWLTGRCLASPGLQSLS